MKDNSVKQTKRKSNLPSGPGPGREKGSKNKFTNLKQAFLDVYDKIEKRSKKDERIKSLYEWATKNDRNQGTFYQLISKMLPSNVGIEGNIKHEHAWSMSDLRKSLEEYNGKQKEREINC